ncbi:MAG: IPT/TIG domain-containing protein [Actinobacteria bacterium]|nr:IPT/TIG domain-containing protein [Actinomycetota bacterium]
MSVKPARELTISALSAAALIATALVAAPAAHASANCAVTQGVDFTTQSELQAILDAGGAGSCFSTVTGDLLTVHFTTGMTLSGTGLESTLPADLSFTGLGAATTILDGGYDGNSGSGTSVIRSIDPSFVADSNMLLLSDLTVRNSVATDRAPVSGYGNVTITNVVTMNNSGTADAGAVYAHRDLTIAGSSFSENHATTSGGAVSSYGDVTITNSTFTGNTTGVDASGGALYQWKTGGSLTVTNSTFANNTASSGGGAIIGNLSGGSVTITNSKFENNSSVRSGGAAYFNTTNGSVQVTGSAFQGNSVTGSSQSGGGLYVSADTPGLGTTTVTDSTFSGNTATQYGGAIYQNYAHLTLTNSTVSGNYATSLAGGIEVFRGALTLNFTTIADNSALSRGNIYTAGRSGIYGDVDGIGSIIASSTAGSCSVYGLNTSAFMVTNDDSCYPGDASEDSSVLTDTAGLDLGVLADNDSAATPITQTHMPGLGNDSTSGSQAIGWVSTFDGAAKAALDCTSSLCYDQRGIERTGSWFWAGAVQGATTPAPVVTGTNAAVLPVGSDPTFDVYGRNLGGVIGLTFNGIECWNADPATTKVYPSNVGTISIAACPVGMLTLGLYPLILTTAGGIASTYWVPVSDAPLAPAFTAASPTTGHINSVYSYTFTASGSPAPRFTLESGSLPPGLTLSAAGVLSGTPTVVGDYPVVIRAANGVSPDALTSQVTILVRNAAPTVSSVSPATGTAAGGTLITITGTGFRAGVTVSVGGAQCTGVLLVGPTQITCRTPVHAAGAVSVAVTNTDSQSGSRAQAFTYAAPVSACPLTVTGLATATRIARAGTTVLVTRAVTVVGCRIVIATAAGAGVSQLGDRVVAKFTVNRASGRVAVTTRGIPRLPVKVRITAVPTTTAHSLSTVWSRTWRAR